MILLLGGTSETQTIAEAIALAGERVLVSRCTDTPLDTGRHELIMVRTGPLDAEGIARIIREEHIRCVVDATHPYAVNATENAISACRQLGVKCLRFERPALGSAPAGIHEVLDHNEAANVACSLGAIILAATGSRNLEPYVREAARTNRTLYVRVLPCDESLLACRSLGIPDSHVISGRGPFSAEANEDLLRKHHVEVLVTKDSGPAGGLPEKLEAAAACGCKVVLVKRPAPPSHVQICRSAEEIEAAIQQLDKCEVQQ